MRFAFLMVVATVILGPPGDVDACCQYPNSCSGFLEPESGSPVVCAASGGAYLPSGDCDPALRLCVPSCCQLVSNCLPMHTISDTVACLTIRGIPRYAGCTQAGICL
jgi:hypothetical protein